MSVRLHAKSTLRFRLQKCIRPLWAVGWTPPRTPTYQSDGAQRFGGGRHCIGGPRRQLYRFASFWTTNDLWTFSPPGFWEKFPTLVHAILLDCVVSLAPNRKESRVSRIVGQCPATIASSISVHIPSYGDADGAIINIRQRNEVKARFVSRLCR